jgi:hypothetical protein
MEALGFFRAVIFSRVIMLASLAGCKVPVGMQKNIN